MPQPALRATPRPASLSYSSDKTKQSVWGLASVVLCVLAAVAVAACFTPIMLRKDWGQHDWAPTVFLMGMFWGLFGVVAGGVGLFVKTRRRQFAIFGLVFNAAVILLSLSLLRWH